MFLSKRSNGIYYLWFFDDLGKKKKVSTRTKLKTDALKFLQSFKQEEARLRIRLQRTSLSQFAVDFLDYAKTNHTPSTQECFKYALSELLRIAGDQPLHKIGVREIEKFLAVKKQEASEWTARKYYIALASIYETAKRWNHVAKNPFRSVAKPKVREIQSAYFTKSEFKTLIDSVNNRDFRELFITAVSTGMRLSELISLQWEQIDFVRKVITVQNSEGFSTKSRKNRVIPMNEHLWKMLAMRKECAVCDNVFHRHEEKLSRHFASKVFKNYGTKTGLSDKLHFHSLRHTFATWLVQDGVPIYEVQKLLGHSSVKMTEVYSHLAASELHSAVNKINLALN
jgi:site-specific recombinase XerD